jgi:predicted dinucleotide-binding enzyme
MNFGTIGAGTVARAIAGHLVTAGHKVTLSNSRGPVFLAVRWPQVGVALAGLPEWDGRILVDTTNNLASMRPTVADTIGFAPVDAGPLRDGGRLMQIGGPLSALHALRQG